GVTVGQVRPGSRVQLAGVRAGDLIVGLDGTSPIDPARLELVLTDRAPGDSVLLSLRRNGAPLEARLQLGTRYGIGLIVVTSIVGALFWGIGLFVYCRRAGEYAARVFAWAMIMLGSTIMMVWPGFPRAHAFLGFAPPLLYLMAYSQAPACILLFFLVYPKRKAVLPTKTAAFLFIPAGVFGSQLGYDYVSAIALGSVERYASYLSRYGPFRIYLIAYLGLSLVALLHSRLTARTRADRNKVQWILGGIVAGSFPFIALWSLPQALGHPPLVPEEVPYLFMMLIPLAFAFSIVRYQALDIEVIVSRGIGYAVVSGLIVALYLGIAGVAGVAIHSSVTRGGRVVLVGCTLLSALVFAPLRRRVQDAVDRTFYRTRYTYRVAMQDLGAAVKAAHTRCAVFAVLRDKANRAIPMETLAVVVCDLQSGTVAVAEALGIDSTGCDTLTSFLQSLNCSGGEIPLPEALRGLGIDAVMPIVIQGNVLGYLAIGRRLSGAAHSDDDLQLLCAMAEEAFMAAERHRLQESVITEHAAAERLGELNRLKSEFIAHVSHELRTPLTSIQWSSENLLDGIPEPSSPRVREYLVGIHESSTRLRHMIENLLDATRIDAGRAESTLESLSLFDSVRTALDVIRPVAERRQIDLRPSCAEGLSVVADRHSMLTILINLLDNAVKYSPPGTQVAVETRAARSGEELPGRAPAVTIAVTDQGIGIPADRLATIFEPFERIRCEGAPRVPGLGLGLHIVRRLVVQRGGRIIVESQPGKGSTFLVTLPASGQAG
ncbi:MAG: ATP-binding protein, partial [Candidatus Eisenbacteria bacterium]|nr:ATP-binding protein [Candidatus Eisenbacteria bacterium]